MREIYDFPSYCPSNSPDQVALVADIFPGVSQERIRRTLHCCQGNIDECVQILLDGSERSHTQVWPPQRKQVPRGIYDVMGLNVPVPSRRKSAQ